MSSSLDIHDKYNRSLWNENDQYKKSQVDIRLINKVKGDDIWCRDLLEDTVSG